MRLFSDWSSDVCSSDLSIAGMTSELEREAYDYFDRIRDLGGVIPAIEENFFQREIAEASFRYQSEVEAGERIVVGVRSEERRGGQDGRRGVCRDDGGRI